MKNRPVGAELLRADRQIDRWREGGADRNSENK
jgi:hypothetical protein